MNILLSTVLNYVAHFHITDKDDSSAPLDSNSDVEEDLEQQLKIDLKQIQTRYASYIDCIHAIVEEKGINATILSTYLINLPASTNTDDERKLQLLSDMKTELQKAEKINDIFSLLSLKYASFLDYDIFETIREQFSVNEDRDELTYPVHLKAYIEKHKIKDFVKLNLNPKLQKLGDDSKKITIKFGIKRIQSLSTLKEVTGAVANILGLRASVLRLYGVKKGNLLVTSLIPASIADAIFTSDTVFSSEQEHEFRAVSVMWFECNGHKFDFREKKENPHESSSGN